MTAVTRALLLLLLLAPAAHAQSTTAPPARAAAQLQWVRARGAETCVDAEELAEQVTARLGRNPFAPDAPRRIEGVIAREDDRWTARLFVRDDGDVLRGTRELVHRGASCAPLGPAVALAVALAIDPDAALRPRPPAPPAATPASPPRAVAPRATPAARPPRPPAQTRPSASVSARFVLALGVLPVPAPGVALAVDGRIWGPLRFTAGLTFLPEQRNAPTGDNRFAFGLTAGTVHACVAPFRGDRVAIDLCGGLHLGAMHAVVYDLVPTQPGARVWAAFGAGGRIAVRIVGPLFAELAVELLVPPVRSRFYIVTPGRSPEDTTVFLVPPVGGFLAAGLGVAIW